MEAQAGEHVLGVHKPGDREAHIVSSETAGGYPLGLCGVEIRLWPLVDDPRQRICRTCQRFSWAARVSRGAVIEDERPDI